MARRVGPGAIDLILSKLCRADDGDLEDISYLIAREGLTRTDLELALERAVVPEVFREIFPSSSERLLGLSPR